MESCDAPGCDEPPPFSVTASDGSDHCRGVDCGGHGSCVGGSCQCTGSWLGERCGTECRFVTLLLYTCALLL